MKGLEPSTFCMASASHRALPFAPVRFNPLFAGISHKRANATEPERTPNLAILATGQAPNPESASFSSLAARLLSQAEYSSNLAALAVDTSYGTFCDPIDQPSAMAYVSGSRVSEHPSWV